MTVSTDMSTPVTRGALREVLKQELAPFATRAETATLATKAEIATFATKADLELWGGALLASIERSEQRLSAEIARQIGLGMKRWSRCSQRAPKRMRRSSIE
ncbi:MAG: hypothetical protein ABIY55_12215 [Kofleriaceae bacterium]